MLEVIKQHNMPLDRIVHVEIMATDTIPADLPPMIEFKKKADQIIKERYGIEVEHIYDKRNYSERFHQQFEKGHEIGRLRGWPLTTNERSWCKHLKTDVMRKIESNKNIIQYIGIAADEPNRFHNLTECKRSPLVEYGVTEAMARERAKKLGLLSPIYTQSTRGGCWFCHNQSIGQLRLLRKQYPEYWALMLKWDNDSPVTFKPDGTTVHMLDERFANEDAQMRFF